MIRTVEIEIGRRAREPRGSVVSHGLQNALIHSFASSRLSYYYSSLSNTLYTVWNWNDRARMVLKS